MWRRLVSSQLKTLSTLRSAPKPNRLSAAAAASSFSPALRPSATLFSRHFSSESGIFLLKSNLFQIFLDTRYFSIYFLSLLFGSTVNCWLRSVIFFFFFIFFTPGNVLKKVEDVMPIATGHEREELEAELQVSLFYK